MSGICGIVNRNGEPVDRQLLTALTDFREKGKTDPLFAELAKIIDKTKGLWSVEAEEYLLKYAPEI